MTATAHDVEVEAAPLDKISADLLQVRIPEKSRLAGIEVGELRLPEHTVVSLIIRDDRPFYSGAPGTDQGGRRTADRHPGRAAGEHRGTAADLGRGGRLARWRDQPD